MRTPCREIPAHLFLGTDADNSDDKIRKGREARGAKVPFTKLQPDQIAAREAFAHGEPVKVIAARFGVSAQAMTFVIQRRTFKYVI